MTTPLSKCRLDPSIRHNLPYRFKMNRRNLKLLVQRARGGSNIACGPSPTQGRCLKYEGGVGARFLRVVWHSVVS